MTIFLFDLDNTLASRDSDELYKHAAFWLAQNRPQRVAICTNQGGVGMRYWMETGGFGEPEEYPTRGQVAQRLNRIAGQVATITGGRVLTFAAFRYQSRKGNWSPVPPGCEDHLEWSKSWRKPAPGMLLQAVQEFGVSPADCVFVGDTIGYNEETSPDRLAAEAVGMEFQWEHEFFGRTVTFTYRPGFLFDWMAPFERVGLDTAASQERFESLVKDRVTSWLHVKDAIFRRDDEMEEDFGFDRHAHVVLAPRETAVSIADMMLRRPYLVYESPRDHVEAMIGRDDVRPALPSQMITIYGMKAEEAFALVEEA